MACSEAGYVRGVLGAAGHAGDPDRHHLFDLDLGARADDRTADVAHPADRTVQQVGGPAGTGMGAARNRGKAVRGFAEQREADLGSVRRDQVPLLGG
ncbi:hypothetical protein GCM10010435_15410 [Winogradskya consettensis]|uniref:Uncharacterized protein n=1 Tax=Winogradskya consettensis TaxID=113560 RepID=A0A919VMR3_9ACTN|nr:hypothetical protein Aco04nite_14690 [Actinoplanes consettensis]